MQTNNVAAPSKNRVVFGYKGRTWEARRFRAGGWGVFLQTKIGTFCVGDADFRGTDNLLTACHFTIDATEGAEW